MAVIHVLDQQTIDRIAAGEVVERPASIVKELSENALDAGAGRIECEIMDGGISYIRVTDNGSGIAKEDVPTAFLRHATSKIDDASDLFSIHSLGFRGEALSSIAAVADVELITRMRGEDLGVSFHIRGGMDAVLRESGAPEGTTVCVRDLFFNTPARKKFLKTAVTEASHIQEILIELALSRPDVSFVFLNHGKEVFRTSGSGELADVVAALYGRRTLPDLIPVSFEAGGFSMSGLAGTPDLARGNRRCEHYSVNGRFFRDALFAKAVEDAYRPHLMQHKFPFVVLHTQIEPEQVDVNVHPGKMEVRFRDRQLIYRNVVSALGEALTNREMIPVSRPEEEERIPSRPEPAPVPYKQPYYRKQDVPQGEEAAKEYFLSEMKKRVAAFYSAGDASVPEIPDTPARPVIEETAPLVSEPVITYEQQRLFSEKAVAAWRLLGQAFGTYWLVEYEDKLLFIDQHAAHEKVLYERLVKRLKTEDIPSQTVSPPVVIPLSPVESDLLAAHEDRFRRLGFEIEHFEGKEYLLRAVPMLLNTLSDKDLFLSMLDELIEDVDTGSAPELLEHALASRACKAAVKGGQLMSEEEAKALFDELLTLEDPYHCPHGRPTMFAMTKAELEKRCKRTV